jgi:LPS-assembly lipoprotein
MSRRLPSYLLALGIVFLLAACGFQLRGVGGAAALPQGWEKMYLVTGNPNGEFSQAVRTVFTTNGVQWAASSDANYSLILGPDKFTQTNLSLNREARVSQFELTMQTTFSVLDASGKEVMPDTTASVMRQMENDPRNVMGKGQELRILQSEMRTELAQQMIRRIGFFASSRQ